MSLKTVAFYCQHLLGIGHLSRSLNVCEKLSERFHVDFLHGGRDVGKTLQQENFQHHFLQPIWMRESDYQLESDCRDLEECWQNRRQKLESLFPNSVDALVVEFFPFGRSKFADEIFFLIDFLKSRNENLKVFSSVRDILVVKGEVETWEKRAHGWFDRSFDYALVHSEKEIVPFDLTFKSAKDLQSKLIYTGFVTENRDVQRVQRRNQVLTSIGGGIVGDDVVLATLDLAPKMPDTHFIFIQSPNMSSDLKNKFSETKEKNIEVIGFSDDYEKLLSESALSISLAGYNTLMNLLRTKTYGLVLPYQKSSEQVLRAGLFAERGLLGVLTEKDLEKRAFAEKVREGIEVGLKGVNTSGFEQALAGTTRTAEIIERLIR